MNLYNYGVELKTLWQIEKLLIWNNFSFCYNVIRSRLLQMRHNASAGGKFNLYGDCAEQSAGLLGGSTVHVM